MVVSRLDKDITYEDTKFMNKQDIGREVSLYEIELLPGLGGIIALGQVQYTFSEKGVLFVPVYLVESDEVVDQIGIYEFTSARYPDLLDGDGDLDIAALTDPMPLLYKFVSRPFLKAHLSPLPPAKEVAESPLSTTVPTTPTVFEQLLGEDDDNDGPDAPTGEMSEQEGYVPGADDVWVQKFMKNRNYNLLDNEAGGDCLYAVVRDAFRGLGAEASVSELRSRVAAEATEETYEYFKEQYDMFSKAIPEARERANALASEIGRLKAKATAERDRNARLAIVTEAKQLVKEHKRVKGEYDHAKELLHDFEFMANVGNLAEFRDILKTCRFWADAWAINTLERALNIKLVILSSANYDAGDLGNVMLCRDVVDPAIQEKGSFKPKHYVIAAYTGEHYLLVTYDGERIFRFATLPRGIKTLIVEKCMERGEGIYNYIPKFRNLKADAAPPPAPSDAPVASPAFDADTVFQFYSRSRDKPPGRGAGEKIDPADSMKYAALAAIPEWRRLLSNFAETPFELDGHKWGSVEAYYQGSKFKEGNPDFYLKFSLDSGSEISKDPVLAKAAGGKTGKSKGRQVRPKSVKVDPNFFEGGRAKTAMYRGQFAKYSQNANARAALLATGDAKLQHYARGQPPVVFYDTMKIREQLRDPKEVK